MKTYLKLTSITCIFLWGVEGSVKNALDLKFDYDFTTAGQGAQSTPVTSRRGSAPNPAQTPAKAHSPSRGGDWKKVKASWYTGPTSRTADGTRMKLDGLWVATRLVPMGTKIEVRNKKGQTWILPRRDTTAKRYGHRLDLPKATWQTVTGAKYSAGLIELEWRPVK